MRRPPAALRKFLEAYDPAVARLFFAARNLVLAAAPEATELVYDAYNAVAVAYSWSDRLKDAFCHITAYRSYVNLGFNQGVALPDPERLLVGGGSRIQHIRIGTADDAERPAVRRLVREAVEHGRPWSAAPPGKPRAVVKAVYAKKRRPSPPRARSQGGG